MVWAMAFDPGGTTGWATQTEWGEITSLSELWQLLERYHPSFIICERYKGGTKYASRPFEVIGVLRLWGELHTAAIFFSSPPPKAARSKSGHAEVARSLLAQFYREKQKE